MALVNPGRTLGNVRQRPSCVRRPRRVAGEFRANSGRVPPEPPGLRSGPRDLRASSGQAPGGAWYTVKGVAVLHLAYFVQRAGAALAPAPRRAARALVARNADAVWQHPTAPPAAPKATERGTGKSRFRMPRDLIGGVPATPSRTPICFAYNLGSCTEHVTNNKCKRGLHIGAKRGCQEPRSAIGCLL